VTHMQVYNAAAKMARATDSGFLPAFVICPNANRRLSNVASEMMQYVRNLFQYCTNYQKSDHSNRGGSNFRPTSSGEIRVRCIKRIQSFRQDGIKRDYQTLPLSRRPLSPVQLATPFEHMHRR